MPDRPVLAQGLEKQTFRSSAATVSREAGRGFDAWLLTQSCDPHINSYVAQANSWQAIAKAGDSHSKSIAAKSA